VTFRKPRPPQNDSTCASIQEDHSGFSLIGGGEIPNSSQFDFHGDNTGSNPVGDAK
jgi:hypothetical protein